MMYMLQNEIRFCSDRTSDTPPAQLFEKEERPVFHKLEEWVRLRLLERCSMIASICLECS
jgi:hypothetical protein